jgi:probable HAF family extracellular repeat protein
MLNSTGSASGQEQWARASLGVKLVALILAAAASLSTAYAAPTTYYFTDLGTLGAGTSVAQDINDVGQVVGMSYLVSGELRAFRTSPNAPINVATDSLGWLGGSPANSYAEGINNLAQVVGVSYSRYGFDSYFTAPNAMIVPPVPAPPPPQQPEPPPAEPNSDMGPFTSSFGTQSTAKAINDKGEIVGVYRVGISGNARGYRVPFGRPINPLTDGLGTLGGAASDATDINENGQIVGSADLPGSAVRHAYRTHNNATAINPAHDLGSFGGTFSHAFAINESGQTVGYSWLAGDAISRAFCIGGDETTLNPALHSLGTLGTGVDSFALDVNDTGIVVGWSEFELNNNTTHAFVYTDGQMSDLHALIAAETPVPQGWVLGLATAINNRGQIVGYGSFGADQRAFLLTPVPEPSTGLCLSALPAALALSKRRRRGN